MHIRITKAGFVVKLIFSNPFDRQIVTNLLKYALFLFRIHPVIGRCANHARWNCVNAQGCELFGQGLGHLHDSTVDGRQSGCTRQRCAAGGADKKRDRAVRA